MSHSYGVIKPADEAPTVSVIIPTRNRAALVGRAVSSVLAQVDVSLEVIVVDDASSDRTLDVLAEFQDRIRVVRSQRNVERGAARNLGARAARGRLLAFLDSDDEWRPHKLSRQLYCAGERLPSVTGIAMVDEAGVIVRKRYAPPTDAAEKILLCNRYLGGASSLLIPCEIFDEVGGFPQGWAVQGSEDWVFLSRLIGAGHGPVVVPEPLVLYRVHDGNATADPDRVAVSMWTAVELFQHEQGLDGEGLRALRRRTATAIARGFAHRGRVRAAISWMLRAARHGTWLQRVQAVSLVALSGLVGRLRRTKKPWRKATRRMLTGKA